LNAESINNKFFHIFIGGKILLSIFQITMSYNNNFREKVFGKIFGFPPWPVEVTETNSQSGKSTVVFVDGLLGKDATTLTFNEENFKKLVKTNKFKKSGKGSKARFLADCNCWGLSFQK
jgi:hypothetical protein